ncbi:MAG: hypothetical protein VB066_04440 [Paludibacter sp.]|nr:hypothetical protein [Paludibacter sp.]
MFRKQVLVFKCREKWQGKLSGTVYTGLSCTVQLYPASQPAAYRISAPHHTG